MKPRADALIIGGGPAGASAAIWLASAGWRVVLVEQHAYPRQKVCGECLTAGTFPLFDELGVGHEVRRLAGAELAQVGWMDADTTLRADMPRCGALSDAHGRALGRDLLDSILLARARALGVDVLQPARVSSVQGRPGEFRCEIADALNKDQPHGTGRPAITVSASVIIDAHGSWERGPRFRVPGMSVDPAEQPDKASDLFAFKATFARSRLAPGFLPVIALPGAYGGMVVANDGRTTVALCVRRDQLQLIRRRHRGVAAGIAIERHLQESCRGVADALRDGERQGSWLAVGPLRPGTRLAETPGIFRVGNASGETHPLVGEGIYMALQSSRLLVHTLIRHADRTGEAQQLSAVHHAYTKAWRTAFSPRLGFAACYAQIAMRPVLSTPVRAALRHWPGLLTTAAVFAGKARAPIDLVGLSEEPA